MFRFYIPPRKQFQEGIEMAHAHYTKMNSFRGKFGDSSAKATANSKVHEKWLFIYTYYFTIEDTAQNKDVIYLVRM